MLGANGGLIGGTRTASALGSGVGLWTPNEQAALRRNRSWPLSGDPFYSYTSLLLSMDGTNNSTTFTDSSIYGLTVTANGDAKISTAQSKFGGSSAAFDGTGDYLSQATNASLALGLGDFTIETWVRLNAYTVFSFWESSPIGAAATRATGFIWYMLADGSMLLYHNSANLITTATSVFALNTWTHVACVRSSGTSKLYVNGASVGSTSTAFNDTAGGRVIGAFCDNVSASPNGYLDDFRITKGVARYTANFTPPTQAHLTYGGYNDPYFPVTSLLLHMDGSNGSTTFTDSSLNALTVTANGNAQISTAQSKFGGASGLFDGTGDWLSGTQSSLIGTGDFTIEAWIYVSSLSNDGEVFCIGDPSSLSAFNIVFEVKSTGAIRGSVQDGSGGVQLDISSSASVILTSTWQHVAFVVSGSSGVVYVDGTSRASGTVTGSRSQNQTAFRIGRLATSIPRDFNGYIDELRITKGVARYTANFTPPSAPFPDL